VLYPAVAAMLMGIYRTHIRLWVFSIFLRQTYNDIYPTSHIGVIIPFATVKAHKIHLSSGQNPEISFHKILVGL
jgi:hypothetical protein